MGIVGYYDLTSDSGADWFAAWATLTGVVVAAVGLYFATLSIRAQTRNSRIEKVADAIIECARRYDDVMRQRDALVSAECEGRRFASPEHELKTAKSYFNRFWALQYEQREFYLLGLVPDHIFKAWCLTRVKDFVDGHDPICGVSFENGWEEHSAKSFSHFSSFVEFVGKLKAIAAGSQDAWIAEVEKLATSQADLAKQGVQLLQKQVDR